jgi:hypothetical protein
MFVGGLGHADLGGSGLDGLLVGDNGLRLDDLNVAEFLLQVVDANLDVQLTATGDNMFTSVFSGDQHPGVGLG